MESDPVRIVDVTMVFHCADGSTRTIDVPEGNDVWVEIADTVEEPIEATIVPHSGAPPYYRRKARGVTITVQVKPGVGPGELIRITDT